MASVLWTLGQSCGHSHQSCGHWVSRVGMASILWTLGQSCGHGISLVGTGSVVWAWHQSCGHWVSLVGMASILWALGQSCGHSINLVGFSVSLVGLDTANVQGMERNEVLQIQLRLLWN